MNCGTAYFYGDLTTQDSYLVGQIIMWPNKSYIPPGFLSCNGQSLPRNTYQDLFNVIGIKFGSNDNQSFSLPKLNHNNTSDFSLMKGDGNMSNNNNSSILNSNVISGGVNIINQTINHSHNLINVSETVNNPPVLDANANNPFNRATVTSSAVITTNAGGVSDERDIVESAHTHNIEYTTNVDHVLSSNQTINKIINTHNAGNQQSVIPKSLKVHYLIYTGV